MTIFKESVHQNLFDSINIFHMSYSTKKNKLYLEIFRVKEIDAKKSEILLEFDLILAYDISV